jgi:hypothetical protein
LRLARRREGPDQVGRSDILDRNIRKLGPDGE